MVTTLPTSTTNMTGFLATVRGSNLKNASLQARTRIVGSKAWSTFATADWLLQFRSYGLPCRRHLEVLDNGS